MNPSVGDLCTWPRNPLVRDSKRRPVVVLSPAYLGWSAWWVNRSGSLIGP